jgi:hypothetical protein
MKGRKSFIDIYIGKDKHGIYYKSLIDKERIMEGFIVQNIKIPKRGSRNVISNKNY